MTTRLVVGERVLQFDVSDVPNNVIEELFDAIASTAAGRDGAVGWHMEPSVYRLELAGQGDDLVRMRLWLREYDAERSGLELEDIIGRRRDILLPLWRGLRQFASFSPTGSQWSASFLDAFPARVLGLRAAIMKGHTAG